MIVGFPDLLHLMIQRVDDVAEPVARRERREVGGFESRTDQPESRVAEAEHPATGERDDIQRQPPETGDFRSRPKCRFEVTPHSDGNLARALGALRQKQARVLAGGSALFRTDPIVISPVSLSPASYS